MESAAPADLSAETRTERHLRLLAELAELGMRLTRTLVAQAEQTPGAEADPQLAYARLTRSIRQTMALETRLADDQKVRRERQARQHRYERQAQVRRRVERAIDADADEADIDDLLCDLNERLSDPDDTDFTNRPLIEVVASICRDLGVAFDPAQWQDEDWPPETPPPPRLNVQSLPPPTSRHPGFRKAKDRDP